MKKIVLGLCITSIVFAASDKEILDFYSQIVKTQIPNAKLSISKRGKAGDSGFDSVELDIIAGSEQSKEILFTKDNLIVPDIVDLKTKTSYRQEYEMKKFQEARINFEKNVKNELKKETQLIVLGDNSKPKMYVFSDPECPYCRQHLRGIEEDLKKYQVNFILTPVHGRSSFEKSALIYKESRNAKNDKEKLSILRKYFNENIKTLPKVSENEVQNVTKLFQKYKNLGFRATPTIIIDK